MPIPLPFAGLDQRTRWVRATLLGASLLGLLASMPLWLNARAFPLLPLTPWFPVLPGPFDKGLFGLMLLALVSAGWFYRPAVTVFLLAGLFAFAEDQNRGQPWFYMYWVLLWLTLLPAPTALAACRWAIAVVYIWSGIQKCNPRFFQVVPAWFVAPAAHWGLPAAGIGVLRCGVALAPLVELFIGIGLWVPRLRRFALGAALVLHLTALLFLGPLGYNYDVVVWPWNLAMIALVLALFAGQADLDLKRTVSELRRSKLALAVLALYSLLPILSYAGLWDSYFSFALYAESQAKADIFVSKAFSDRLPPAMRSHVHQLRQAYDPKIQGPYVFDFQTWGFRELHVPPILEPRNYRAIFQFLRAYAKDPDDLRMIIAPRAGPATFYQGDGHWPLTSSR